MQDAGLVLLKNENLTLGIWPDAAGRAVYLGDRQGDNLLYSDSALRAEPVPQPTLDAPWRTYNGHIMWIGPQNGWWAQQDLRPDRKQALPDWPPDPFLIYGRYTVSRQSDASVTLEGPASTVSGLQLTKRYTFTGPNTLRLDVTAVNRRSTPVAWDLWSNTRFRTDAWSFVPVADPRTIRYDYGLKRVPAHEEICGVENGWFYMLPPGGGMPGPDEVKCKVFITPTVPVIAAVADRWLFIKRRLSELDTPLHPEQSPVEIYGDYFSDQERLLELEMHSPHRELQPGESIEWSEAWQVIKLDAAPQTLAERIAVIEQHVNH